jgi:hypothetical protein
MGRFTIIVSDELDTEFRIAAVKRRIRLNKAFEEAMRLWLEREISGSF